MGRSGSQSYKSFLSNISKYGVSIKSRYEMTFSGIENVQFFVTNVSVPAVKFETTEMNFDGRKVEVPIFHQYDHDFTMTVINDNTGSLYRAFKSYMIGEECQYHITTNQTLRIKVLGDLTHSGFTICLHHVRIKSVGSLSFGQADNDVSTFDVECSAVSWSA